MLEINDDYVHHVVETSVGLVECLAVFATFKENVGRWLN
jgi:hypothetical protein